MINSIINSNIQLFINTCCQPPTPSNLRMGITEIYNIYKEWSLKHSKDFVKQTLFKTEIERAGIKDDERKGVDINNKPGKRGYNIMVKI
jgi:phage/plasmid-associated DNA primase